MKKYLAIAIMLLGLISAIIFIVNGAELSDLRSIGGRSVAEAYYQGMGGYGIALGFAILAISLGMGANLLKSDDTGRRTVNLADYKGSRELNEENFIDFWVKWCNSEVDEHSTLLGEYGWTEDEVWDYVDTIFRVGGRGEAVVELVRDRNAFAAEQLKLGWRRDDD